MDETGTIEVKCWSCKKRGTYKSLEEALEEDFNFPEPNVVDDADAELGVVQCICKACMEKQARGETVEKLEDLPGNDELLTLAIKEGHFSDALEVLDTEDVEKLHKELLRDYHLSAILDFQPDSIVEAVKRLGWQDQLLEGVKP